MRDRAWEGLVMSCAENGGSIPTNGGAVSRRVREEASSDAPFGPFFWYQSVTLLATPLITTCYYATTTTFHTFVTSDTFVELAESIPEHISSLSTGLLPRRYVRPKVGPSIGPRRRPDT